MAAPTPVAIAARLDPHLTLAEQLSHATLADVRYLLAGRIVPAAAYALLGYEVVLHGISSASQLAPVDWLSVLGGPVRLFLFAAFCLIPVVLFVVRPRPQAADGRVLPRLVAFLGTVVLLLVGAYLPGGPAVLPVPAWMGSACSVLLVVATAGAIGSLLSLRLSFGIFPAARRLVTGGLYRLVRHPLYLCEILAALAMLLSDGHLGPLLLITAFCGLQVARIRYEEALLRRIFPEWADWAHGRARLIPWVW